MGAEDSPNRSPTNIITSSVVPQQEGDGDSKAELKKDIHRDDVSRSSFRQSLTSSFRGSFSAIRAKGLGKVFSPRDEDNKGNVNIQMSRPTSGGLFSCFCGSSRMPSIGTVLTMDDSLFTQKPDVVPEAPLLPPASADCANKITLVLDLDETLVHSTFVPVKEAHFTIPLDMGGETHVVYVQKRPGVEHFLKTVAQWYEVVVFTASLALYANPVIDRLDPTHCVRHRLFREHCVFVDGNYVKDLSLLGRDIRKVIIIDNSPVTYAFQPENALPSISWVSDPDDRELDEFLEILEKAKTLKDVRNARV